MPVGSLWYKVLYKLRGYERVSPNEWLKIPKEIYLRTYINNVLDSVAFTRLDEIIRKYLSNVIWRI